MERKLVKQGRNALTVTLPAQWIKAKGLKPGNSVFIEEGKNLIITAAGAAKKSVEIDAREQNKAVMFHLMMRAYIEGDDLITMRHANPKTAQEIAQWLIGMVTEEHTATKLVLKSIIVVPEDNFEALLRRAAHMLVQQARMLVDVTRGVTKPEDIKQQEYLLDANILYCMRYLTKYGHESSHRQFTLCSTIELAADHISQLAKHIGKNRSLAELLLKHISEYVAGLFTNDLDRLHASLRSFRNAIGTKTFCEGIAASLIEILYNYIGYLAGERKVKGIPAG